MGDEPREVVPHFTRPVEFSARTGMSISTIYREIEAGRLPQPILVSPNCVGWTDAQLEGWLAERMRLTAERAAKAAARKAARKNGKR